MQGGGVKKRSGWGLDSGLVVVLFITAVYIILVFALVFYVKNEWCYVLFKNFTENPDCFRQDSRDNFLMGGQKESILDETRRKHKGTS